jgi:thiamine-phosphate pyrophosphorylase
VADPAAIDLRSRRLYLCTGDRPDLEEFIAACIRGGVDVVQLREKNLDDRALIARAAAANAVCASFGVPFVVNDRADVALASGADGVHVGQDDVPVAVARAILGPQALIGLSTHAPAEWDAATNEFADYLSAGPVVATPTKPGRPGTGLGYVEYVATTPASRLIPWFVTGGASPQSVPDMVGAGARRFVVVRYLTESLEPEASARELSAAIDAALAALPET